MTLSDEELRWLARHDAEIDVLRSTAADMSKDLAVVTEELKSLGHRLSMLIATLSSLCVAIVGLAITVGLTR